MANFGEALLRCTMRCGMVPSRQVFSGKGTLVHTPLGAVIGVPRGTRGGPASEAALPSAASLPPASVVTPPVPPPVPPDPPWPVVVDTELDEAQPARAATT